MRCSRCQAENREGRRFCSKCGAALALACASCSFTNEASDEFCGGCGALLRSPPAVAQPKFGSPESYTPKHLAEKILTSKAALQGERKQVTVLFADLKGSMELLADRDPEEARKLLDPVLERMMEAVHRYEGTVNQVMGDGIMALFGAPLAHEDHAVRACYAALRMQDVVRRYSDELRRTRGVEVEIRVGLNSGDVVVRSIGSDLRMDYTAVGQTTHLAARMEQLAAPGSIRLTAETLHLAEGFVQVSPLGPVPIKGLGEPVEIFELVGAGAARTRLEAAARRGLTRFVGRTAELEQLRGALDRASLGHGQVVAVVGEPGVGKSRLFWELTHSHRVHGWLIVQSASVSYGKATAYLPVIELLRGYFEIDSHDDPRKIREKVTGKVLTLAPALGPAVSALLALLDVPVDEASWHALDPPQRRQQMLDAVKRLLLRESEVQPLVVVFEDLHWIDGETQTLLDSLVESLPAARLLLLVNYRPEYRHAWGGKTYYRQLRIDPLPPESADELLEALLGPDAALGPLKQLLVDRTEANPLFLEESVRALVETGGLAGERGAYRLTRAVEQLKIPTSVQAILAARIDRLAPEAKRLLQAAAVIGKDVPMPLLLAIADAPEHEVRPELTHLQAAEFLYETRLFPDLEYTFKHALTHEVAYQGLLQERRRALHARIAEAIEQLSPERVAEQAERLAHHALRGELWEKATAFARQAGLKAVAHSSYQDAVTHFTQALATLQHMPENRATREQAIDLRLELRGALLPLGEFGRMLDVLREADELAGRLGDAHRTARVTAYLTDYYRQVGEHDHAVSIGRRALEAAHQAGDLSLRVAAGIYLGHAYQNRGQYREAADLFATTVAAIDDDLSGERFGLPFLPAAHIRTWHSFCLGELGEFDSALVEAQEALRVAERANHPASIASAHFGVGRSYLRRGQVAQAVPDLDRAEMLARQWKLRVLLPMILEARGIAHAATGRESEALSLLKEALEIHTSLRGSAGQSPRWSALSGVHLLAGRITEATRAAVRALELAEKHGERGHQAYALHALSAAALRAGDTGTASRTYREALAVSEELEMRPLSTRCHLGLATLLERVGDPVGAETHRAVAKREREAMAMVTPIEALDPEPPPR